MSSSAEAAWARGNELFIEEEYDQAAPFYDQAIRQDSTVPKYFLNRAGNHLKLKNFIDVVADTEKCLELNPRNAMACFRKGLAYFSLNEFESALTAFQDADRFGAKKCDLWIRKCQAEIRESQKESVVEVKTPGVLEKQKKARVETMAMDTSEDKKEAPKSKTREEPRKKVEEPKREEPKKKVVVEEPPQAPQPPQPLAQKVREAWVQKTDSIEITLFVKNLTDEKVQTSLSGRQLTVKLLLPDASVYDKTWNLYGVIKEGGMKAKVNAFKVEITLEKGAPGEWKGLEGQPPEGVVLRENNVTECGHVPAPYSSKKDWNSVESEVKKEMAESKETEGGGDGFTRLMQSIYGDADDETRRAMMKSYQTSGGTVLNCNWKEVRTKDYESEGITPPAGQEVRKWKE